MPFENLSVHLGEKIVLEEEPLLEKIVNARRGGFCYELNGAFGALLSGLGYRVELLQARVYGDEGRLGVPYDHLALSVGTADGGGSWLADVGFGRHSHYPLALGERGEQAEEGGVFRIAEAEAGAADGDLDVLHDGRPVYRLERRPRLLADFEAGAWWHSTSPASHFTRSLVCSRLTEEGRLTLSGRKLTRTVGDERKEEELSGDAEVLNVYRERFGIVLDRVPEPLHLPA
ncbi:arylamine N-acetyltransferase [Streptomyces sp. GC420]|uniref:arylamine N-acetyltransferase family protein n=1 Tax=Streptomyces sp. GC420 TaxID=2697568 RepID=UPI001414E33E|nr:arylamine N-acetyltransferase [Streptomyces sp. GC420]NBM14813.1 arylamine N-acetyltransferase [Streptomyces sp. GC420]